MHAAEQVVSASGAETHQSGKPGKQQTNRDTMVVGSALFRSEALQAQIDTDHGGIIARLPLAWWMIMGFVTAALVASVLFAVTTNVSRKETVGGLLRPRGGEAKMLPPIRGTIQHVAVQEGDQVLPGQTLVRLSTRQTLETGEGLDIRVLAALAREEDSLRQRLAAMEASAAANLAAGQARLTGIRADWHSETASLGILAERIVLAEERLDAGRHLAEKGLLPSEEVRRRRSTLLELRQAEAAARGRIAALDSRITESEQDLAAQPHRLADSRGQIAGALAALEQRKVQAEGQLGVEVVASAAGRIAALQAKVGEAADPNKPLMIIVPPDAELIAELYVPSRAIPHIQPGQAVRLLYDGFPYQRFGAGSGKVVTISATVLAPGDVQAALKLEEAVYLVVVNLDRQHMYAYGHEIPLQAGMALKADLILEERSFLAWLLDPIYALRGRL